MLLLDRFCQSNKFQKKSNMVSKTSFECLPGEFPKIFSKGRLWEVDSGNLWDVISRLQIRTFPGRQIGTSPVRQIGRSLGWSNRIFRRPSEEVWGKSPQDVLGSIFTGWEVSKFFENLSQWNKENMGPEYWFWLIFIPLYWPFKTKF